MKKIISIVLLLVTLLAIECSKEEKKPESIKTPPATTTKIMDTATNKPATTSPAKPRITETGEIKREDMNFGKIYYGQPLTEVIAIFGQPVKKKPMAPVGVSYLFIKNNAKIWIGSSAQIETARVNGITIEGNAGLITKAGIRYGSTAEDVIKVYGKKKIFQVPSGNDGYGAGVKYVIWYSTKIEKAIDKNVYHGMRYFYFGLDDNKKVKKMTCWEEWD